MATEDTNEASDPATRRPRLAPIHGEEVARVRFGEHELLLTVEIRRGRSHRVVNVYKAKCTPAGDVCTRIFVVALGVGAAGELRDALSAAIDRIESSRGRGSPRPRIAGEQVRRPGEAPASFLRTPRGSAQEAT